MPRYSLTCSACTTEANRRARGKESPQEMAEFGEKVLFQPRAKYAAADKLGARWNDGALLGINHRTNEVTWGGRRRDRQIGVVRASPEKERGVASPTCT